MCMRLMLHCGGWSIALKVFQGVLSLDGLKGHYVILAKQWSTSLYGIGYSVISVVILCSQSDKYTIHSANTAQNLLVQQL